jgi:ArsR family transcriptional regulator
MDLAACLKALGEPMRLAIFQQILTRRHCTRSLAKILGITESAVSQHLKILKDADMIYDVKRGYHMLHLPSQEAMDFLALSFEQMRQASVDLDRDPKLCRCEFRQCPVGKSSAACRGDDMSSTQQDGP